MSQTRFLRPASRTVGLMIMSFLAPLVALGAGRSADRIAPPPAAHLITVETEGGARKTLEARVVAGDDRTDLLLLTRDGQMAIVPAAAAIERRPAPAAFQPMSRQEMTAELHQKFGPRFEVRSTAHYLVCYNTTKDYARHCGTLFERLYMAFTNYWKQRGFSVHDPEFPLVALVFATKEEFRRHAAPEVGPNVDQVIGYYSLYSNRMTLYDFGVRLGANSEWPVTSNPCELARELSPRAPNSPLSTLNSILAQRASARRGLVLGGAEMGIATLVHEATHQLAFNCGFHRRFADNPLWLAEGMAIYFETPDLTSATGWRGLGKLNRSRWLRFRDYCRQRRPTDSLRQLITRDDRLRQPATGLDAYAEAWALTYYLIRTKSESYFAYLRRLAQKQPLHTDSPEVRLADFQTEFGDIQDVDREMLRYIDGVN